MVISCWKAVLQNNSRCLLLNILINATRYIFQFVRNEDTKNEHKRTRRNQKKIWIKSKRRRVSSSNIYRCICISVLTSTNTCWLKLNRMFSFSSFIWKTFSSSLIPRFPLFFLSSRHKNSHRSCSIEKAVL